MSELRMLVAEAEEHNLRTLGLAVSDLRGLFSQIDHLTTELAASRAREAKMREALEKIELELREYNALWVADGTDAADCVTVSRALRDYAHAALSASEDA